MVQQEKANARLPNGRRNNKAKSGIQNRLWIIGFLFLFGAGAVVLAGWIRKPTSNDTNAVANTFTVRVDDLTITVTESGSVKAQESTDVTCEVEGRGLEIADIIPEGTVITQEDVDNGKIICLLNASELKDTYNRELIDFSSAQASYLEAQEAHLIQKKQNESDIAASQLAVEFGLMDLQNYLGETASRKLIDQMDRDPNSTIDMAGILAFLEDPNGEGGGAKQTLKELNDSIILAEQRLTQAQSELESTMKLFKANYAPQIEVRQKELSVNSYRVQYEQASDALDLFKRYDFPKQTKQLLSDYHEAQRELDRTFARTRSKLAQTQAKLESSKARFDLQQEHVTKLERQIAACTIRAPAPGIAIYGTSADWYRRREDPIEIGDMVRKGQKIFTIPNSDLMGVELRVHEASVNMVDPGQRVEITVEAFPDLVFYGKVISVAPLPDPQHGWLDPGVKVYTTQVSIDGKHDVLKPGMSAKVKIFVEQLDDVKIVPVQVVANRSGKKVSYVVNGDEVEEREVQTGLFNDTYVEVIDGLEAGEKVLLVPPRVVQPGIEEDSPADESPKEEEQPEESEEEQSPPAVNSSIDSA
ncbi:MAG: efflux RND transporter periplasmic adaptor subunit [Sedimentisphaerales bacterium]|nr:efflux RND transporter periplasmic adaptor subunit [Sedimentisphaerales bacterium]